MTTEKQFICKCGKTFTNSQSFNGHKSNCKIHHEAKYGSTLILSAKYEKAAKSISNSYAEAREKRKQSELITWQQAKHTCERCGKIMTEKFGSGRFCSKKCANTRTHSDETKNKISSSMKAAKIKPPAVKIYKDNSSTELHAKSAITLHTRCMDKYYQNPKYCKVCGTIIEYNRRDHITCSKNCSKQIAGGIRERAGIGKHGKYKGYYCDSTYELAYVIYNIDHQIDFERNTISYTYIGTDSKEHRYFPDFIENDYLVEIKGYITENVQLKLNAVQNRKIKLLTLNEIQPMIDYVKKTYGCKHIEELYDT